MNKTLLGTFIVVGLIAVAGAGYFALRTPAAPPSPGQPSTNASENLAPGNEQNVPAGTEATGERVYTLADLAQHASPTSCWTAIRGSVYDVTSFIKEHPGGQEKIGNLCEKDGTTAFTKQHGGKEQQETTLAELKIGALAL